MRNLVVVFVLRARPQNWNLMKCSKVFFQVFILHARLSGTDKRTLKKCQKLMSSIGRISITPRSTIFRTALERERVFLTASILLWSTICCDVWYASFSDQRLKWLLSLKLISLGWEEDFGWKWFSRTWTKTIENTNFHSRYVTESVVRTTRSAIPNSMPIKEDTDINGLLSRIENGINVDKNMDQWDL